MVKITLELLWGDASGDFSFFSVNYLASPLLPTPTFQAQLWPFGIWKVEWFGLLASMIVDHLFSSDAPITNLKDSGRDFWYYDVVQYSVERRFV